MKTNVELEFINKVSELSESMQNLANFWTENEDLLEDVSERKNYPFSKSLDELATDIYIWQLALINDHCEKDPNTMFDFFDAYYKSLQK